jgi:hypothetical protein
MIKLMAALDSDIGRTPIEINAICGTTRASSDVSELRQNGVDIEKEFLGTTPSGRKVFAYRLAKS